MIPLKFIVVVHACGVFALAPGVAVGQRIRFEVQEATLVLDGTAPGCDGEFQSRQLEGSFYLTVTSQTSHGASCSITDLMLSSVDGEEHFVTGSGEYLVAADPRVFVDDPPPGVWCALLLVDVDDLRGIKLYVDECLLRDDPFPIVSFSGFTQGRPFVSCLGLLVNRARPADDEPFVFFRRGDLDGDGQVSLVDALTLVLHLFRGQLELECADAADSDDDGVIQLTDALLILDHLFRGVGFLPAPSVLCGVDLQSDALECRGQAPCRW